MGSQCHHEEHGENTHHHDHDQSPSDVSNGVSKQENESNSNSELIKEEDDSMVEYLTKKTKVDPEAELDLLGMVLSQIFSEQAITIDHAHRKILLSYDELSASVELDTHTVESEDIELKDRLLKVLKWTRVSFGPCPVLDEFNLHKSL